MFGFSPFSHPPSAPNNLVLLPLHWVVHGWKGRYCNQKAYKSLVAPPKHKTIGDFPPLPASDTSSAAVSPVPFPPSSLEGNMSNSLVFPFSTSPRSISSSKSSKTGGTLLAALFLFHSLSNGHRLSTNLRPLLKLLYLYGYSLLLVIADNEIIHGR